jgi:hypothetical protein
MHNAQLLLKNPIIKKSPFIPLFQRGRYIPLFGKEGLGEILWT